MKAGKGITVNAKNQQEKKSEICGTIFTCVCAVGIAVVFGVVNFLQFREITVLKERVTLLEQRALHWSSDDDILIENVSESRKVLGTEHHRKKRQVPVDSLTQFVTSLVNQEVKVLENYCGNSSKICLPGPKGGKGDQGLQGLQGAPGVPGPKGQQGNYGVPGVPGLKGDPGVKGDMGLPGAPGIPGPKGQKGNYGIPGIPGLKGEPGLKGAIGLKGEKGDAAKPLPVAQQCCTALNKPSYQGKSQEIVKAYVGSTPLLPCKGLGFPAPNIKWTPAIDPQGSGRYVLTANGMQIQNVRQTDSGTFDCEVHNALGTVHKQIQLVVTDPVTVTTQPRTLSLAAGQTLSISCDASGSPAPNTTWYHIKPDGSREEIHTGISTQNGHVILTINSVNAINAGQYICFAQNAYETDQATTDVSIAAKPQIIDPPQTQTVKEGATVTLKCGIVPGTQGTTTWNYPLTKDKPPLNAQSNPDGSITLIAVDKFNNGQYTCTSTNQYGSTSAGATLTVQRGVSAQTNPRAIPLNGNEPAVTLSCSGDGDPKPTLSWSKVGSPGTLTSGGKYVQLSNSLLVTSPSAATDTGIYVCTADNGSDMDNDTITVYKNLGQHPCATAFGGLTCSVGQICGVQCGNCPLLPNNLYGYKVYPGLSEVCLAGKHSGVLPNSNNVVIFRPQRGSPTFAAKLSNGIQSQYSGPTSESYEILDVSDVPTAGTTILG